MTQVLSDVMINGCEQIHHFFNIWRVLYSLDVDVTQNKPSKDLISFCKVIHVKLTVLALFSVKID